MRGNKTPPSVPYRVGYSIIDGSADPSTTPNTLWYDHANSKLMLDNIEIVTGVGAVPGGNNMDVQFNDLGVFGGDSGLTYNKGEQKLWTTFLYNDEEIECHRILCHDTIETNSLECNGISSIGGGILFMPTIGTARIEGNCTQEVIIDRLATEHRVGEPFHRVIQSLFQGPVNFHQFWYDVREDIFHSGALGYHFHAYTTTSPDLQFVVSGDDSCRVVSWCEDRDGSVSFAKMLGGIIVDPTGSFSAINSFSSLNVTDLVEIDTIHWNGFDEDYKCTTFSKTSKEAGKMTWRALDAFLFTERFGTDIRYQTVELNIEQGKFNFEADHNSVQDLCLFNSNGASSSEARIRIGYDDLSTHYAGWNMHAKRSTISTMSELCFYPTHATDGYNIDEIPFTLYYPFTPATKGKDCSMLFCGDRSEITIGYRGQYEVGTFHILRRDASHRHAITVQSHNDSYTQTLISFNAMRDDGGMPDLRACHAGGTAAIQVLGDDFALNDGAGSIRFQVTDATDSINTYLRTHLTLVSDTGHADLESGNFKQSNGLTMALSAGMQVMCRAPGTGIIYPMTNLTATANSANVYHSGGEIRRVISSIRYKTILERPSINPDWLLDVVMESFTVMGETKESYGPIAEAIYELNPKAVTTISDSEDVINKEDGIQLEDGSWVDSLNYNQFTFSLIELAQKQQIDIDDLTMQVDSLNTQIETIDSNYIALQTDYLSLLDRIEALENA